MTSSARPTAARSVLQTTVAVAGICVAVSVFWMGALYSGRTAQAQTENVVQTSAASHSASAGWNTTKVWVPTVALTGESAAPPLAVDPLPVDSSAPVADSLAAAGIPTVALAAYLHAAEVLTRSAPSCGLNWSVLAGIGRVESNHGRFGGSTLLADGTSSPPIRGPQLNGTVFALVLDTDHGVLDGDPVYDRAVGPMQLLPATWRAVASDGNGDGKTDPDNIFDAALGAGRYLCSGGANLADANGLRTAVLRYNHSDEYANLVLALATSYRTALVTVPAGVAVVTVLSTSVLNTSSLSTVDVQPPTTATLSVTASPTTTPPTRTVVCTTSPTTPTPTSTPETTTSTPTSTTPTPTSTTTPPSTTTPATLVALIEIICLVG